MGHTNRSRNEETSTHPFNRLKLRSAVYRLNIAASSLGSPTNQTLKHFMGHASETTKIIVDVDGSGASLEALRQARFLAKSLDAHVEAIGCWENPRMYDGYVLMGIEGFRESAQKVVTQAVTNVFGSDTPPNVTITLVQGDPKSSLIKASMNANFLVVGRRGHGRLGKLLIGSVSAACIAHAKCPVIVVHSPEDAESH